MPRPAIHPGEILAELELTELGVTPTELSRQINVPPNRVTQYPWTPWRHRRHRPSPRALVRHERAVLAKPAKRLRHPRRRAQSRAGNRAASDPADRSRCGAAEAADAAVSDRAGDTERARLTLPFSARARQAGPHQPEDQACRGDPLCVVALGGILPFDLDHYSGWSGG